VTDRLTSALVELVDALRAELRAETPAGPDRLLDIAAACDRLSLGRTRVYHEIASGALRSISAGRRRLVPESAIGEYIATQQRTDRVSETPRPVRRGGRSDRRPRAAA